MKPIVAILFTCWLVGLFLISGVSADTCGSLGDNFSRIVKFCKSSDCAVEFVLKKLRRRPKILLPYGTYVDTVDNGSYTPLVYAAKKGDLKLGKLLLSYGANANHKVSKDYHKTPLHYSAENGFTDFAGLLIKYGAYVNEFDDRRQTPIFYASGEGKLNTTQFLVKKGADVDILNYSDKDPAQYTGYKEVSSWLSAHIPKYE